MVCKLIRGMGSVSVNGITGCQSPTVRSKTLPLLGVTDTIGAIDKGEIAHLIEITGTVFVG